MAPRKTRGNARSIVQSDATVSRRVFNPPSIPGNVVITRRFRFSADNFLNNAPVTTAEVLSALGVLAVTSTSAYRLAQSARIKEVEIWQTPVANTSTNIELTWSQDAQFGPNMQFTASALSTAAPAHLKLRPPKDSNASFWFNAGTTSTVLFTVSVSEFAIVDLVVEYMIFDKSATASTTASGTGLVPGAIYYGPLATSLTAVALPPLT